MYIAFIIGLIFGGICALITSTQPRNSLTWFMLGVLLGPVALLYLIFVKAPKVTD